MLSHRGCRGDGVDEGHVTQGISNVCSGLVAIEGLHCGLALANSRCLGINCEPRSLPNKLRGITIQAILRGDFPCTPGGTKIDRSVGTGTGPREWHIGARVGSHTRMNA